ncbi:hypothetical protein ACVGVM_28240 (plasmid) [Pseudonocardia bannensis]|uniref:Uncharacterized protein n=1 Tax=Pseudonocardia bannensis TaxID=630973 RepID=A0A848DSH1_9PSEU|nr:hypothetical protein [Pseudonocardia bannensis]NMH95688.1 hypothetical protein [Pseudonocardia bannensis]
MSEAPPHEIAKELGGSGPLGARGPLGVLGMHLQGYDCAGAMRCPTGRAAQRRRCGQRVPQH